MRENEEGDDDEILTLTPEVVATAREAIWKQAQEWRQRSDTQNGWPIHPGSHLARDDRLTSPRQVSHGARAVLNAALDHHHAAGALYVEAGALHAYAGATLLRAAIETSSVVVWMLGPDDHRVRIRRSLQWSAQDLRDQTRAALSDEGEAEVRAEYLRRATEQLGSIADSLNLPMAEILQGFRSSEAVRYADDHARSRSGRAPSVLLTWQLTSGYAHGRRWAPLAFSEREEMPSEDPGSVYVRLSMSEDRLVLLMHAASEVTEMAIKLFDSRASRVTPPRAKR